MKGDAHMRRASGIIRLDIVKSDERVLPAPPTTRSFDVIWATSIIAVRHGADSDDHIHSPEICLESRACVWQRLLRIRPPRLDLRREHPMRVFDEAGQRTCVVQP